MSNCITGDLESCNNVVLGPKSVFLFVYNFPLILNVFININVYANYIHVICICNHLMKDLCVSFSLVPNIKIVQSQRSRISISCDMIGFTGLSPFFRIT